MPVGEQNIGSLPDYLIIGAQKCATSSLFGYLQQHPRVRPPAHKEIHFFDSQFAKGLAWYRRHFPPRQTADADRWLTGEASPSYLLNPHAARRIKEALGPVKLIFSLRDPVERAFSHYRHMVKRGRETRPFKEAIQNEQEIAEEWRRVLADETYPDQVLRDKSYLLRGHYLPQIDRYLAQFDRADLHVILYDDIQADPQGVMSGLCDFLGLEPHDFDVSKRLNVGREGSLDPATRQALAAYYTQSNRRLSEFLGRQLGWG